MDISRLRSHDGGPSAGLLAILALLVVCPSSGGAAARESDAPTSLRIVAHVNGKDELHISHRWAGWVNLSHGSPRNVEINGRKWNPLAQPQWEAGRDSPLLRVDIDLAGAIFKKLRGRGGVDFGYDARGLVVTFDELTIRFDDRIPPGGDEYLARVQIPLAALVRVEVRCDQPAYTAGEQLRILRFREGDTDPEIVSGQRVIDLRGRCIAALPPGKYEFEVQTSRTPNVLVALRSGQVRVDSQHAKVRLRASRIQTTDLRIAGHPPLKLTDIGIRSILPTGDVSWRRTAPTERLGLILSPDQTYRVRAMGSNGVTHAVVWKELAARELSRITDQTDQWIELSFDWHPETLPRRKSGVVFHFPDTKAELPPADRTRLLTNRRFVELGYWYELDNGRKVSFHRCGYVLPGAPADHQLTLGGPITGRASAAVMQNQNLGNANMKQIWCDISAQDTAAHTLDVKKS